MSQLPLTGSLFRGTKKLRTDRRGGEKRAVLTFDGARLSRYGELGGRPDVIEAAAYAQLQEFKKSEVSTYAKSSSSMARTPKSTKRTREVPVSISGFSVVWAEVP